VHDESQLAASIAFLIVASLCLARMVSASRYEFATLGI
jgi:hypothetical protein